MSDPQMIGRVGAMGKAHAAVDTFLEREVAIKSLRAELTQDQLRRRRLGVQNDKRKRQRAEQQGSARRRSTPESLSIMELAPADDRSRLLFLRLCPVNLERSFAAMRVLISHCRRSRRMRASAAISATYLERAHLSRNRKDLEKG